MTRPIARKRCARCGEEQRLEDFPPNGTRRHSYCRRCMGAYARERNRRLRDAGYRRPPSLGLRYAQLRRGAEVRGLSFALTREEVGAFWEQPCHYSGGTFAGVALDRLDNTRGYEAGNVVSCCGLCNIWKHDLSEAAFRSHLERIYQHAVLGRSPAPALVEPLLRRSALMRALAASRQECAGLRRECADAKRTLAASEEACAAAREALRLGSAPAQAALNDAWMTLAASRAGPRGPAPDPRARAGRRAGAGRGAPGGAPPAISKSARPPAPPTRPL